MYLEVVGGNVTIAPNATFGDVMTRCRVLNVKVKFVLLRSISYHLFKHMDYVLFNKKNIAHYLENDLTNTI